MLYLFRLLGSLSNEFSWIGLMNVGGVDTWVNGDTDAGYRNWASSEPSMGVDFCIYLDKSGSWYTVDCALAGITGYVCEIAGACV